MAHMVGEIKYTDYHLGLCKTRLKVAGNMGWTWMELPETAKK